ncbi:MAG: apolipoprotein N-acyltransferase [Bacteroidales bacterium]|nr:apolipoprotein N-acyltransferase [Bacteroidales bacterium]
MKNHQIILFSIVSGVLLALSWPVNGFPGLLFVSFIPLLWIEDHILKHRAKYSKVSILLFALPGFAIWNILTTYWIGYSTLFGLSMAIMVNTLLMSLVFLVYHLVRRNLPNNRHGYFILVFLWIAFEYFHLDWDLSWPWLNLGNGFSSWHKWVQWYEYTGVLGGSFWVLSINILLYKTYGNFKQNEKRSFYKHLIFSIVGILLPVFISLFMYHSYEEKNNPIDVVIVQPNMDPYHEQYELSAREVVGEITNLTDQKMDSNVQFIVAPESIIQEAPLWETNLWDSESLNLLADYIKIHPNVSLIIGASTYYYFEEGEKLSLAAREFTDAPNKYYEAYNTSIFIDSTQQFQLYHKSKLTPGVEQMPFRKLFKNIEKYALDLGGTVGTLGIDSIRKPFTTKTGDRVAPVICYESVYGEFVAGFVRNGAQAIFIITNDGWWKNTPGHKQHLSFASLRAIETRRSIARSANTGVSAFVNQRGDIQQATNYWEADVIRQNIHLNEKLTFYVKYGDYLGRTSLFASLLLVLIAIAQAMKNRGKLA